MGFQYKKTAGTNKQNMLLFASFSLPPTHTHVHARHTQGTTLFRREFTCRASRLETAIAPTYGRLSITASAKSEMKVASHPSAGTRPQISIPDFIANSLYSTSISSRVSICSLTKLWIKHQTLITKLSSTIHTYDCLVCIRTGRS